ncbi:MAG TPA: sulfite exporter TauE/SafE family protein, partial [Trueperaceae bacterium]
MTFWISLAIGLLAGFFGGLVGLGGGVVIVPLLTGWMHLSQHKAHATSLVAVVFTGLLGALAYSQGGAVNWLAALLLTLAATLATTLSARFARHVPAAMLRRLFGYLLIITGLLLPLEGLLPPLGFADSAVLMPLVLLVGGLVVGSVSGLLGIGGGSIMVPLLVLALGFDQHLAQGTSLAAMIPAALGGSIVHWRMGSVAKGLVVSLVVGVAAGSWFGGSFALAIPDLWLQLIFALVMIWLGLRYVLRSGARKRAEESAASPSS